MLCLVCVYIKPMSLWVAQSGFAVAGRILEGSGLEVRCTGMRIHHCHHSVEQVFLTHTAGKSPIVQFAWEHPDVLCSSCVVCGGHFTQQSKE